MKRFLWMIFCIAAGQAAIPVHAAEPVPGEALVAAATGKVTAQVYDGPVHEGGPETVSLFEGAALRDGDRVTTGKNGHLCLVFTPGAIVCVAPDTDLTIESLRHQAEGLPKRIEDIQRRIDLRLDAGKIYVHAGPPKGSLDLRIHFRDGSVQAAGGSFIVSQQEGGDWKVLNEEYDGLQVNSGSTSLELAEGELAEVTESEATARAAKSGETESLLNFEICQSLFSYLEPFFDTVNGFDRMGFSDFLGLQEGPILLGSSADITDVSPSYRDPVRSALPGARSGASTPDGRRWPPRRIRDWWDDIGVVRGVNYIPRTAINSTEFWMESTYDPETIEEELGWAKRVGYTDLRVPLQFIVWDEDPEGFRDRFEDFLDLASEKDLRVVPVLFDDLNRAGQEPALGEQPDPEPDRHNSQWTPSPGLARAENQDAWPRLEAYVKDVMDQHSDDERILYWDLYNTVGQSGVGERTLPLMDQAIQWAREVDPDQPIAVPAWRQYGGALTARKLERSDMVTFHSYQPKEGMEATLQFLQVYERPIICSDWLLRQNENTFAEILPLFAEYRVGWFNRGLVKGKTQMHLQQAEFQSDDEDVWQHDVLEPDGEPYRDKEVQMIRAFEYSDSEGG